MPSPMEELSNLWSTTRFRARTLTAYAERLMVDETRNGLMALSFLFLLMLFGGVMVALQIGLERDYVYTCAALAALAVHTYFSARRIREIGALHALGMALLVISAVAFVLLVHRTGSLGAALLSSVVLLLMVVPVVPWGLREASIVTLLIYGLFSASTWSASDRFDANTLWMLQAFMMGAAVVSLSLVARSTQVRKEDIHTRFQLEDAHRKMQRLSYQDPLTKAWNRRFLESEFPGFVERVRKADGVFHVGIIDIDRFKELNDTLGHVYGDQVLQWVASVFQQSLGDSGHLIRTGGDEFILLLATDQPEMLIDDALTSLEERQRLTGRPDAPRTSLSIGLVSVPPGVEATLDDVYRVADEALYRAKRCQPGGARGSHLIRTTLTRTPEGNGRPTCG